jgi:hypothetical protein
MKLQYNERLAARDEQLLIWLAALSERCWKLTIIVGPKSTCGEAAIHSDVGQDLVIWHR